MTIRAAEFSPVRADTRDDMKSLDSTATLTVSYIWGEAVKLSSLYFARKGTDSHIFCQAEQWRALQRISRCHLEGSGIP